MAAAAADQSPAAQTSAPRFVVAGGPETLTVPLQLDSHLIVERNVGVTARRDGLVEEILAERGDRVAEGDLLARLERQDLVLAEQAARLEVNKQEASFARAQRLREEAVIPGEEFEQAQLRRDAADTELQRIRHLLTRCEIRAPFDGIISGRFVEKGQFIKEDDRRVLFQVTALAPLLARVYAPEWALPWLREGQAAQVTPRAHAGARTDDSVVTPARLRWINDVLDAASGTVEILAEIDQAGRYASTLRPGMSVVVAIEIAAHTTVTLPREVFGPTTLAPGDRLDLTVLDAAGDRLRRTVTLGLPGATRVAVRSGLTAGERVLLPE